MVVAGLVLKGRYRLDSHIGAGGMGDVWQGTDLALGRVVAVKLLRPECAQDEDGLARFRAEARHAALLSHPNIVRVYDYCEAAPPVPGCMVTELVDGLSLARLLDEGPMSPARTMGIIAQAAAGLQAAHAAGVVHRDIKPGNLLVSRDGQVKITDFGIAHVAGSASVTRTGVLMGTPAYLAPERAAGASATPAADLYALGVVAYQCMAGDVPFDGEPMAVVWAHVHRRLPPLPPSVPAGVSALIASLAAKDPGARPSCAGHVATSARQLRAAPAEVAAARRGRRGITGPAVIRRRPRSWLRTALIGRAALVLAGMMVASLGWAVTILPGSAPAHAQSSGGHSAARHAGPQRPAMRTHGSPRPDRAADPANGHPEPAAGRD